MTSASPAWPESTDQLNFPREFIFGVATAAYQIEGGVEQDGRGASIWDTFSHTPGRVVNGDTGDVACDHYHLWEKDLDLIASLGVDAYRFSIAWSRLFPTGKGQLNTRGLAFYDRLIDGALERGIKPYATLYHWDLPQTLADQGGWIDRGTADAFAHYAASVMDHYGDRIEAITTFNEPWCSAMLGYLEGIHAPGERSLGKAMAVVHGQHRAHSLAIQAMRASRADVPLGIVLNAQSVYPASDTEQDRQAAVRHETFHNDLYFGPLFKGQYPQDIATHLGNLLPSDWSDDLRDIHQPLDYWGLNFYTPSYVTTDHTVDKPFPATTTVKRSGVPTTDIGWEIDANTFSDLLVSLHKRYTLPPCYITENGAAFNHEIDNGIINDQPRIAYVHQHLQAVFNAMSHGVDVRAHYSTFPEYYRHACT